jgi:hypothetical protein
MKKIISLTIVFAVVGMLSARPVVRIPHVGYACPAGGKAGTTALMVVGGQYLNGLRSGIVSGQGVKVLEAKLFRPIKRFSNMTRGELRPMIKNIEEGREPLYRHPKLLARLKKSTRKKFIPDDQTIPGVGASRNKLAAVLKKLSPLEYQLLTHLVFKRRNALQMSPAIAQLALVKLEIAPDAKPGIRKLWLRSSLGLSNSINIMVGSLPEICEPGYKLVGRNQLKPGKKPDIYVPGLINGQIMPGEVDSYKFMAEKGKTYRFVMYGRTLVPFLSDAVPGWFQPVISIADSKGKVLAFADDYLYKPDPILNFTAPADGEYELQIRDAIYRGREDFVYRVAITEDNASLKTGKLPEPAFKLTKVSEFEPNNNVKQPQTVKFPVLVYGQINHPGDVDNYCIAGKAGDELVVEVIARRLGSPVDSRLNIFDATGKKIHWNDDFRRLNVGLQTHHSDSYIHFKLPTDGIYTIQIADTQRKGGDGFDYYLRLDRPKPDFKVYLQPSVLNIETGIGTALLLHIVREDGFDEDINLSLKQAPEGFKLSGTRIPAGTDKIQVVLTVPVKIKAKKLELSIAAKAVIDGKKVTRKVIPADEIMQAFLWTHVVPAEKFQVVKSRRRWKVSRLDPLKQKIKLVPGGTAEITVKTNKVSKTQKIFFELESPPKGIVLKKTIPGENYKVKLIIAAESNAKALNGNLIVRCLVNGTYISKKDNKKRKYVSDSGVLAAVPIQVTVTAEKSKDLATAK